MPEIQKYNLKNELLEADKKYMNSTSTVGMSAMTQPAYINSTRTQMFTSHLRQFLNIITPNFPRVFTSAENVAGKYSSGYKQTKHKYEVYKKVEKYGDILDEPNIYYMFLYDKKRNKFDVVERKPLKSLMENFAYKYNTEKIDSLKEGDVVDKGTVLYKSTSYDESMNYRYGRNATVIYSLDPFTSEDAAIISESFSKKMTSVKSETIPFYLNDNDIPLNLHGDQDDYKPLPDIGQPVRGIVAASRLQVNEQLLVDGKDANLMKVFDPDKPVYYKGNGVVVDYEIYCNDPDIQRNSFTDQIIDYLESQNRFYEELKETCEEIMKSGASYTRNVDYVYKRACEFLNNITKRWIGDHKFGKFEIRVTIMEYSPLKIGGKFTGRMGNKSVVAKVVPDDEMPHTKDGKVVEVILNLLAIINRTTGFVPHEMYINFATNRLREQLATMSSLKEQEKLLFDVIKILNEKQEKEMHAHFKTLSTEEKKGYIKDCIEDGIYIHQQPIWEGKYPIFTRLRMLDEKYDWLKPYDLYLTKWGQEIKIMKPYYLGEMYMIRLKQTDDRGFSARNSGAVNTKDLPDRSYKNRTNQALVSDTAIRFGEFESLNFLIGMMPEELAVFNIFYRTSPKARKDILKSIFMDGIVQIDDSYTSAVAQYFAVIMKSLSLGLEFLDEDDVIDAYDDRIIKEQFYDGKTYLCTDYQMCMIKLEDRVRKAILDANPIMNQYELDELVDEELKMNSRLIGSYKDIQEVKKELAFFHIDEKKE